MAKKAAKKKAEKKPKAPKPEMVSLPKYVREHWEEVKSKEREVRELESIYETAKAEASAAKKDFERADLQLRNMISGGPDKQNKLPFEEPVAKPAEAVKVISRVRLMAPVGGLEKDAEVDVDAADGKLSFIVAGSPPEVPPFAVYLEPGQYEAISWLETPVDSDAWRKAPTTDLGLAPKLTELLPKTIGEIEDLRAAIADGKKEWPKGIGNGKVTLIEDAVIGWLTKNRDKFHQAA